MTRLLIVDDHAIVREGLRLLLEDVPTLEVVGEAANGQQALELAAALRPEVVLLDLAMPVLGGLETARRLRAAQPECRILVLTSFAEDQDVRTAMQLGVAGYLLKDVLKADLVAAIERAARGEPVLHPEVQRKLIQQLSQPEAEPLTEREREVLRSIARGLSNREIADHLHITRYVQQFEVHRQPVLRFVEHLHEVDVVDPSVRLDLEQGALRA